MSGRSGASGSVRSGAGSVRLGPAGPHALALDALYERKRDNKSVRVLTVVIYVFCVSLAAIMLSLYYVFFWEPKDAQYAQRKVSHTVDQQTSTTPMPTCFMSHTGESHTQVREDGAAPAPFPANISAASPPSSESRSATEPPFELPTSLGPPTSDVTGPSISLNDTQPT